MNTPNVYLSFDPRNQLDRILFTGQVKNSITPFTITNWSEKTDLEKSQIQKKLMNVDLGILLVNKNSQSCTSMISEINLFNELHIPFFGVYLDGSTIEYKLPKGLSLLRTVVWNWEYIGQWVLQCMTERKC